jgi:uncharacterized protein (TIGR00661 family)
MARILYGVAGEGFGHCSRAHLIGQRLLDAGHDVMFVGFNKAPLYLRQVFGDRAREILGLSFEYHRGHISPWRTFERNLLRFPGIVRRNRRFFRREMDRFGSDLVLSDFEPFSAWWAWRNRVPLVSVDNEHVLTHCRLAPLQGQGISRLIARSVTRCYAFRAEAYVVLNFFHVPVLGRSVFLAPPVVRSIVTELPSTEKDYLLVYASTGQGYNELMEVLQQFPRQRFLIYGFDLCTEQGHCTFKRRSTEGFLEDLAGCRGVIASAGFSLISECMVLKKRMLLVPVDGQYEQRVNASYAEKLGLGVWSHRLTPAAVSRFLDHLVCPIPMHPDILWPDNERFFGILQGALGRLSLPQGVGLDPRPA